MYGQKARSIAGPRVRVARAMHKPPRDRNNRPEKVSGRFQSVEKELAIS